jgi:hypothetical protein
MPEATSWTNPKVNQWSLNFKFSHFRFAKKVIRDQVLGVRDSYNGERNNPDRGKLSVCIHKFK